MDVEQLVMNIRKARDAAREEAQDYRRRADAERAKGGMHDVAAAVGLGNVAVALEVLEKSLSRILDEDS